MRAGISHELFVSGAGLVGAAPKIRNHSGAKQGRSLARGSRYGFMHKGKTQGAASRNCIA